MPEVGINDVLIRVRKTGICGTDLHIDSWDPWAAKTIQPPLVVGHEFVGEIVEVGSNVSDFHPGDLVSGEGHVVRPLPALHGRPAPPVREHRGARRRSGWRVRRVRGAADDQHLASLAGGRRGGRRDLRPVRERGPHRPRVRGPRRGRPHLGCRPDRAHDDPRRPARRRAPCRRLGADRLPAGARREDGRHVRSIRPRPTSTTSRRSWAWWKASTSCSRCPAIRPRSRAPSRTWPMAVGSRSWGSRPATSPSTSTRSSSTS